MIRVRRLLAASVAAMAVVLVSAAGASGAIVGSSISGSATPSQVSKNTFEGVALSASADVTYSPGPPADPTPKPTVAVLHFDNDFFFEDTGIPPCTEDISAADTAAAMAACGDSKIGSGSVAYSGLFPVTGVLTIFNGTDVGGVQYVIFHFRTSASTTLVANIPVEFSALGPDFGIKMTVPLQTFAGIAPTHIDLTMDQRATTGPVGHVVNARCNDADKLWNFATVWTYDDTSTRTDTDTHPCTLRQRTLTATVTGSGSVTADGINCPGDCSEVVDDGTVVTFDPPVAASGSTFTGWTGACTGTGPCTVTMNGDKTVNAQFGATATRSLMVSKSGPGTVTGPGISCPGDCFETYAEGSNVQLTADPDPGAEFSGWTGSCSGTGQCSLTMDANKAVEALFAEEGVEPATVNGTVEAPAGGGPVQGALVVACSTSCITDTSDSSGNYSIELPPGETYVEASPPVTGPQYRSAWLPEFTTAPGETVNDKDLTLGPAPQAPPPDTVVGGPGGIIGGIPVVIVGSPFTLTTQAEEGCDVTYAISVDGDTVRSGSMAHSPPPAGRFTATVAALEDGGIGVVTIEVANCPTPAEDETIEFNIYIDPSGYIRNGNTGQVIAGATVVLLRSDSPFGPFIQVPDGSAIMSPGNRTNPDTTDATGHFGWDVIAGYYKVRASAPGCVTGETQVYEIPPPVTDIDLHLSCPPASGGGGGQTAQTSSNPPASPKKCRKGQKLKKGKCVKAKRKKKK